MCSVTAASDTPFCPLLKYCFVTTYSNNCIFVALLPSLYCLITVYNLSSCEKTLLFKT